MYCTQGLSVANAIFATIAISALQRLSPSLYSISQEVGIATDKQTCLTSLVSSSSSSTQCLVERDQCAAPSNGNPSSTLNGSQAETICEALSNPQCLAPPPLRGTNTTVPRMRCGIEVNLFTDLRPDDLWSIAALFAQATALRCEPQAYPIKHVFGGGGWDEHLSLQMLRRLLLALREVGIVPDDNAFDIAQQTHQGPIDWDNNRPRYWSFYGALGPDFPQHEWNSHFFSVLDNVRQPLVLANQRAPIMLLLRPVSEFFVQYAVYLRSHNLITDNVLRDNFLEEIADDRFPAAEASTMMDIWSRSTVISSQRHPSYSALFHVNQRMFWNASLALADDFSRTYFNLPLKTILLDPDLLFGTQGYVPIRPSVTMFTEHILPQVYQALDRHPVIAFMFRFHAQNWNLGNLSFWASLLANIISNRRFGIAFLTAFHNVQQLADQGRRQIGSGTFVDQQYVQWEDYIRQLRTLLDRVPLSPTEARTALGQLRSWCEVALSANTRVNVRDLLVRLAFTTQDTAVQRSLQRVQYQGMAQRGPIWVPPPPGFVSNIWLTSQLGDANDGDERTENILIELRDAYTNFWLD